MSAVPVASQRAPWLAIHRKQRAAFDARLGDVLAPYTTSAALRRLREKKLAG